MNGAKVINTILEREGIKAATFAKQIGVTSAQVYDLQKGKIKGISSAVADKIIKVYPHYSKAWLMTGEGEMLKSEEKPESIQEGNIIKLNILNTPIAMNPNKSDYTIVTPMPIGATNKGKPTRDMVKRLRLAVPESANMKASVVMQYLFDNHPNTALWIATGKDNIVAMDKLEVEALKGQLQALKMLNESLMKENEAIRAKIDAERKLL